MWLLDTSSLELREFFDRDVPPYAILSHTWSFPNEVSFVEMQNRHSDDVGLDKSGFAKITQFCRISKEHGYDYCWIDTCCIDKRNSADLSEAINAMYRYYYEAGECLIFLDDVDPSDDWVSVNEQELFVRLHHSRWFTRGWTLQELIAPKTRLFYARDWSPITANNGTLYKTIAKITGVKADVLRERDKASHCCAAERLSWASRRRTTRSEDMAYSLVGLFNISLPILYGQGGKAAFRRFQEEILRTSFDQSIFVWKASGRACPESSGLLADSPADFADTPRLGLWAPKSLAPFSMTNVGLSIRLNVIKASAEELEWIPQEESDKTDGDVVYIGLVTCDVFDGREGVWTLLALYLKRVRNATFLINGQTCQAYRRVKCDTWTAVPPGALLGRSGPSHFTNVLVLEDEHYGMVQRANSEHDERWIMRREGGMDDKRWSGGEGEARLSASLAKRSTA